jgi:hypothetical protein
VLDEQETLAHPEQPRFLLSTWFWAVALFVFFGVLVVIVFAAMPRGSTYESTRAKARVEKLKTAREGWAKSTDSYAWVDKGKGLARIPITRAMELELADLQKEQPHPAGPIATPAPEAAATAVPVSETGAPQPSAPPVPTPAAQPSQGEKLGESAGSTQPAGAAQPPNAPPHTQPGPNATPAANPNSHTEMPPVTPSVTPVQHAPGTPLPVRGKQPAPSASPTAH